LFSRVGAGTLLAVQIDITGGKEVSLNNVATDREHGYSLVEVVVALAIGLLVVSSAFVFLEGGREALAREPQVAEMNANVRSALARVSADLTVAGIGTPSEIAVLWHDGVQGGTDAITILYADADAPIARPRPCEGGCDSIGSQSALVLDPASLSPEPVDYEAAYAPGAILFALQSPLAGPECADARPALVWFELTGAPRCSSDLEGKGRAADCSALTLSHGAVRKLEGVDPAAGVGSAVDPACAFVGAFHAIQYRLSSGELERRDLFQGEAWNPVAANIADFQLQYMQGFGGRFEDAPPAFPSAFSPGTWLTAVRIAVAASGDELPMRFSLSTTVSLRNQLGQASMWPSETAAVGWN
jgi:prepilin-type N-terminal cleavage/methylation domain-containing protein